MTAQTTSKRSAGKVRPACGPDCEAGNKKAVLSCKLSSAELRQRKETVIAGLKAKVISKKELGAGYAYHFSGSDEVVDELTSFIKTERQCCDFFRFRLANEGDSSEAVLEITGPKGVKEFITAVLAL